MGISQDGNIKTLCQRSAKKTPILPDAQELSWKGPGMQPITFCHSGVNGNHKDFSRTVRRDKINFLITFSES